MIIDLLYNDLYNKLTYNNSWTLVEGNSYFSLQALYYYIYKYWSYLYFFSSINEQNFTFGRRRHDFDGQCHRLWESGKNFLFHAYVLFFIILFSHF